MLHKQVSQAAAIILDQRLFRKRKINLDLKTSTDEFMSFHKIFSSRKGDLLISKVGIKQLPHWLYTVFRSKKLAVQAWKMNYGELRRTQRNRQTLNADLRYGKEETYSCRSTAEDRRRSLDRLRLMQRPRLRKTRCSAAAAELERQ